MNRTSYNLSQGAEDASTERVDTNYRVLAYKEKVPTPEAGYQNKLRVLYSKNDPNMVKSSIPTRPLPSSPEKTLNAPDLRNDYYLNLLDWGANNMLAVARCTCGTRRVAAWTKSVPAKTATTCAPSRG